MMFATRFYTNLALEMVDQGLVSGEALAAMCLAYMSERDVEDMMRDNGLLEEPVCE